MTNGWTFIRCGSQDRRRMAEGATADFQRELRRKGRSKIWRLSAVRDGSGGGIDS